MEAYDELMARYKETRMLESIGGVIGWDERTYMPPKGSAHRAEQMAVLAKLSHQKLTDLRIGDLLGTLERAPLAKSAESVQAVNIREIRRVYDIATKLPESLVEELARVTTRAQNVWQEARKNDDFASFAPWLEK